MWYWTNQSHSRTTFPVDSVWRMGGRTEEAPGEKDRMCRHDAIPRHGITSETSTLTAPLRTGLFDRVHPPHQVTQGGQRAPINHRAATTHGGTDEPRERRPPLQAGPTAAHPRTGTAGSTGPRSARVGVCWGVRTRSVLSSNVQRASHYAACALAAAPRRSRGFRPEVRLRPATSSKHMRRSLHLYHSCALRYPSSSECNR